MNKKNTIRLLVLFLISFSLCVIISFPLNAKRTKQCRFIGKINGVRVHGFRCEIARAGTSLYLLGGLRYKKRNWMFDLSGIRKRPGPAVLYLKMMGKSSGGRITYRGRIKTIIYYDRKDRNIRFIKVNTDLKDSTRKKTIRMKSVFVWRVDKWKSESGGRLSLNFGKYRMQNPKVKLAPWNNGYRLNRIFILKPGNTVNFTLEIPGLKNRVYYGKATIIHTVYKKKLKMKFFKGKIKTRIRRRGKKIVINFSGIVSHRGVNRSILGSFDGTID